MLNKLDSLNVLLLSQFFSTTRGGGEHVFSITAKSLAEKGNKIWIITNRIKNESYPSNKNIKIVFVEPTLEYKGGLPPSFSDNIGYVLHAVKVGLSIIKHENVDLIHSNNFAPALAGSMLSTLTSRPHVTTVHDVFSLCGKNYWKLWGKQSDVSRINVLLAPFFEKLMIKLNYDAIHTVSEASKEDLVKFGAKKPIYVIPNTIEFSEMVSAEAIPIQFIYVGRLVFYKNLEIVIKAINVVRKEVPKIKLIIVGDGPHKETLVKLVKNLQLESHIEFKGHVTEDEKMKLIASSNALVLPSLCEGFGLVILEAFSQNRPVLASNLRPMSDIVSHENTGYVLGAHDENVWAAHLMKLIKNPEIASKMGKNGNHVLFTSYGQDSMYEKLRRLYSDVLKRKTK